MKDIKDQYIQQLLDEGKYKKLPGNDSDPDAYIQLYSMLGKDIPKGLPGTENDSDLDAYIQLYSMLGKDIPQGLPMDFSAKVTRQLQLQRQRKENRSLVWSMAAVMLLCLSVASAFMFFMDKQYHTSFIASLNDYKWIIGLSLVFLFLIQYFDYRSVKSKNFYIPRHT